MTLVARVAKLEKAFDASDEYEYDLEQLLELSHGVAASKVGSPRRPVKPDRPTLAELIYKAVPPEWRQVP
jgi:hypothetical protein